MQITPLWEVLQEAYAGGLQVNPTDLRRIFATDGLSPQLPSRVGDYPCRDPNTIWLSQHRG
jgi:hypothetical protein